MGDRDLVALHAVLERARKSARRWADTSRDDRVAFVVSQVRSIAAEVNSAYLEQRSGGPNYRLCGDDVLALWSWAEWAEYGLDLQRWRAADEKHEASWQLQERFPSGLTDSDKATLETAPRRPEKPRAVLPEGLGPMPSLDRPRCWDDVVGEFLSRRHGAAEGERQ